MGGSYRAEAVPETGDHPMLQVPVEAAWHRLLPCAKFALHQAHRGTEAVAPCAPSSDRPLALTEWL